jgi:hypothetical protein
MLIARALIIIGVVALVVGIILLWFPGVVRLGQLPGDMHFRKGGVVVYLPLATCVLFSAVVSLILWLLFGGKW